MSTDEPIEVKMYCNKCSPMLAIKHLVVFILGHAMAVCQKCGHMEEIE